MFRLSILPSAAAMLIALALPAGAETLACQTVNGQTVCMHGPGSLSCQTTNGHTVCTRSAAPSAAPSAEIAQPVLPPDLFDGSFGQSLSIEQDGTGLRIRGGGLDLRLN